MSSKYEEIIKGYSEIVKDYERMISKKNKIEDNLLEELNILKQENQRLKNGNHKKEYHEKPLDIENKQEQEESNTLNHEVKYRVWIIISLILIALILLSAIVYLIINPEVFWMIIFFLVIPGWFIYWIFNLFKSS